MKTNELTGIALDWAVCVAVYGYGADYKTHRYSTDWAQGGPIIEREQISTTYDRHWVYDPTDPGDNGERWFAENLSDRYNSHGMYGPTPLIAAMRCYVASKLGDNIDIPKELTC